VLCGFAGFGFFWGAWGAVLPAVRESAGVTNAELGLALLFVAAGALASMRATGALVDRFGPAITSLTTFAFGAAAILPAIVESAVALAAALLVLGVASGAMDVAINADGVREEDVSGRPLLNLAHAVFSACVIAGSLLTGGLRELGAGDEIVLASVAVTLIGTAVAVRAPIRRSRSVSPSSVRPGGPARRVPPWLLTLGLLCALAYWVENAWQSWSAVHLHETLGAAAGVSALGPAAFAGAAMLGRLAGHRLTQRFAERLVVSIGAGLAAVGTVIAATASIVPVAVLGIMLAGAGSSVCAPTIISLAGRASRRDQRARAVSTVTTLAYLGFLVGPASVGGVAGLVSLRVALLGVAGLALLLAILFAVTPLPSPGQGRDQDEQDACCGGPDGPAENEAH
jgi:MFS family permease